MRHLILCFLFLSTQLLAQDLDYSKYRYFEEDKEFQTFLYSTISNGNQLISKASNITDETFLAFSTIDFETKTAEHKFYNSFNSNEIKIVRFINEKTYLVRKNIENNNFHLYVIQKNEISEEFQSTEYILDSSSTESSSGALFVINDRILFVSIECETQGPSNREMTLRVYEAKQQKLNLLKTTVTKITEFQDISSYLPSGFNDHLFYIQLIGTDTDGILIKFDAQNFTTTKLPLNNRFSLLGWSAEGSVKKHASDSGFVMAEIIQNPNNISKKKMYFSHYNTIDQEWYYNNENSLFRNDSLTYGDSKFFDPTFNQLPNGDYISTANVYEFSSNEWHSTKRGYQRTLLQVYSNEKRPKIKGAYLYELPNGSNILSSVIQPDSTILLIGYSQDDNGVFSTLYLNIGKGPGAVGVNDNEQQTHLKFSLINNHQNLRLFNPKLSRVEIYDEWGRLLIAKDGNQQNIDIGSLPSGLYILRTKTQGETAFKMTNFVKP